MTWTRRLVAGLLAVLAASGLWLWPLSLGGSASYVITSGVSMEPGIHQDDLVIVRRADRVAIGDVIAYRSDLLGTVVLHRIVDRQGAGYVVKGDNNPWLDPERPTVDDFVGKAVLHIPDGGIWLKRLTAAPALAAYAFLLLVGGTAATRNRRERKKERRTVSPRHRAHPSSALAALHPALKPVAAGAVAIGLTGLALSGLSYTRPTTTTVPANESVESSMTFGYTAQVEPSAAYDGTTVTAPQPVFRNLADQVDVTYSYAGPAGTLAVAAELSASSGWRTTVPLSEPVEVGEKHDGSVRLDLSSLEQRAAEAAEVIGMPASSLTVAVVPTVALDGGGEFAPRLELALDDLALTPTGELTAQDATSTSGTRTEPNRLSLLGKALDVSTGRLAGLAGLALALLAVAALAATTRLTGPVAESERIRHRYGSLVLPVLPMTLAAGRPVVDVPDVDSLVRLAERYGLLVLAWSRGGVDTYVVQDEGTTFRYRSSDVHEQALVPALAD